MIVDRKCKTEIYKRHKQINSSINIYSLHTVTINIHILYLTKFTTKDKTYQRCLVKVQMYAG